MTQVTGIEGGIGVRQTCGSRMCQGGGLQMFIDIGPVESGIKPSYSKCLSPTYELVTRVVPSEGED